TRASERSSLAEVLAAGLAAAGFAAGDAAVGEAAAGGLTAGVAGGALPTRGSAARGLDASLEEAEARAASGARTGGGASGATPTERASPGKDDLLVRARSGGTPASRPLVTAV